MRGSPILWFVLGIVAYAVYIHKIQGVPREYAKK